MLHENTTKFWVSLGYRTTLLSRSASISYDWEAFLVTLFGRCRYVTTDEFEICTYLISCNLAVSWFCMFISVFTSCLFIVWSCVTTWLNLLRSEVTNEYSVLICVVSSPTLLWRLLQQSKDRNISEFAPSELAPYKFTPYFLSLPWTGITPNYS